MKPTFSFALLALAAASCGKVGLDRPADEDAVDAGGATDAARDVANTDGAPAVDAPQDTPAPPLAATIQAPSVLSTLVPAVPPPIRNFST